MTKRNRRTHSAAFKAKVALAARQGRADAGRTGAAVRGASEPDHGMEAAIAGTCCRCVRRGGARVNEPPVDLKALHAKIGQLALENDFLESALSKAGLLSAKR